jgi:DNA-binding MarR family transcriptional regulator
MRRRGRGNKKGPESGASVGRVLDYIASKGGAISMAQATKDLGIPLEDLTGAIEKLKAEGWLKAT